MRKKLEQRILFILIIIGLPILANLIVEIATKVITIDLIMKCVYLTLGAIIIYLFREVR